MVGEIVSYRAFISYSHADARWGTWLHRELERFRAPRQLVGAGGDKLGRCFRDEAEMGAAADLPAKIARALNASQWLVVICSPRSAASEWVNKEIRDFKALGRDQRVLALIVEGTPGGSVDPEAALATRECFPATLRTRADGGVAEPLAVDVRKYGRADAIVRLVSEIIGVEYDALRQREVRRRRWALIRAQALFVTGLVLTAGALAGGYFAAENYAATSKARSALFAREANALAADNQHAKAALMALEGDLAAHKSIVEQWFDPEGYAPARNAVVRAVSLNSLEATLRPGGGRVWDIAFMPDGRMLSAHEDGIIRLWKMGASEPVAVFDGGSSAKVISLLGAGGEFLSGHGDGRTLRWRIGSSTPVEAFSSGSAVRSIAVGWDGGFATSHEDGTASEWAPPQAAAVRTLDVENYRIAFVGADVTNQRYVTLDRRGDMRAWDESAEILVRKTMNAGLATGFSAFALERDGGRLAVGDLEGRVVLQTLGDVTNERLLDQQGRGDVVTSLSFGKLSNTMMSSHSDGTVFVWPHGQSSPPSTFRTDGVAVTSAARSDDEARLAAGTIDGDILVWRLPTVRAVSDAAEVAVEPLADGKRLAVVYEDGRIALRTISDNSIVPVVGPEGRGIDSIKVDPEAQYALVSYSDGELTRISLVDPKASRVSESRQDDRVILIFSDAERYLTADGGGGMSLRRFGVREPEATFNAEGSIESVAVAADGKRIVTGHSGGAVRVWSVGTKEPVREHKSGAQRTVSVALSPVDDTVLSGHNDGRIRLWRPDLDEASVVYPDRKGWVMFLAFAEDGTAFAAGYNRTPTTLWLVGESEPLAELDIDLSDSAAWSRAGQFDRPFIQGDGSVRPISVPQIATGAAVEQVRLACEALRTMGVADFSESDWQRFPILDRNAPHPCRGVWGFDPRKTEAVK